MSTCSVQSHDQSCEFPAFISQAIYVRTVKICCFILTFHFAYAINSGIRKSEEISNKGFIFMVLVLNESR